MKSWHVEILDADENVLTQADVEASSVRQIECVRSADFVGILVDGQTVATGYLTIEQVLQGGFIGRRTPSSGRKPDDVAVRS